MSRTSRAQRCASRHRRIMRLVSLTCISATAGGLAAEPADPRLLIDGEPFDEITLDAANGHARLQVARLPAADRNVDPRRKKKLTVRLLDDPVTLYEVDTKHIETITPFESLVLDQAKDLLRQNRLDAAFRELTFLQETYPKTPGLDDAIASFLITSAGAAFRAKQYDQAFAQLLQLHQRNPKRAELPRAMDRTLDRLLDRAVRDQAYAAARSLLEVAQLRLRDLSLPSTAAWRQKLIDLANAEFASARDQNKAGDYESARQACRRALAIWPHLAEAVSLLHTLQQEHPSVVVGVAAVLESPPRSPRVDDWATRRVSHLVRPTLVELSGYNDEGPVYACPFGQLEQNATGTEIRIALREGIRPFGSERAVTGYDVTQDLLAQFARPPTARIAAAAGDLRGIRVESVFRVTVTFQRAVVRPLSLLEVAVRAGSAAAGADGPPGGPVGPYRFEAAHQGEARYAIQPSYQAPQSGQMQRIVERPFADGDAAVAALRQGEIDVLDRIPPWHIASLERDPQIEVRRYALPTVHLLVANIHRPRMDERAVRRGIGYAIGRQAIVEQVLLRDRPRTGFTALSGPFPVGMSLDDPLGAAADRRIAPRPYEPRLAVVLMDTALRDAMLRERADAASPRDGAADERPRPEGKAPSPKARPAGPWRLVLAHPPGPTIRIACEAIRAHLRLIDIDVQLREIAPGAPRSAYAQADLIYAELALWEPIADSHRLFGDGGLVGSPSPYMQWALRRLREARNWTEARKRLWEIHRIAAAEARIIPLWQTPNYFAYRASWRGLGDHPLELYQYVARWRASPEAPHLAAPARPARAAGTTAQRRLADTRNAP